MPWLEIAAVSAGAVALGRTLARVAGAPACAAVGFRLARAVLLR